MIGRIFFIAWKELLQVRRDRLTMMMMVALPIMQLLLFGYAINTDVRNVPTVIYDQDWSRSSRDLVHRMEATGFYEIKGHVRTYPEVEVAMRQTKARVALVIPSNFSARLDAMEPTQLQLIIDGSDPQTVGSARDTAIGVAQALSTEKQAENLVRQGQRPSPQLISVEPLLWYNPDLRTAVYIVPGLAGVILTLTMVMFTSMAIARERERGTLEQLIVSPIRSWELILGKILPYVMIGYLQLSLILLAGRLVFKVHLIGSVLGLYLVASLFIAASLAVGLVFSTIARTQQQAMQLSFFFLLPNILLSGFMFPWEAMPRPVQWMSQVLPLTHFLRIIRGIVLKGASLVELGVEIGWLTGGLLFFVAVASLRFRKKLS